MLASQFATDCYERMAARRPSADDGEAFPPHNNTSTMRTFLTSGTLCIALGLGFWYALTSTLDDMTRRDCQAGVQLACQQLKEAGL